MTDDAETPAARALSINKDTQFCLSLAARPGHFGTRFHHFLYAEPGLDDVHKALTTRDLAAAIGGVRALARLFTRPTSYEANQHALDTTLAVRLLTRMVEVLTPPDSTSTPLGKFCG